MSSRAETIGARVRYWRMRRNGMTQAVLAGLAGVSQSYISQVESGRKTIDRRSTLVAVAAALQVTVADLLGQGTEPVTRPGTVPPRAYWRSGPRSSRSRTASGARRPAPGTR